MRKIVHSLLQQKNTHHNAHHHPTSVQPRSNHFEQFLNHFEHFLVAETNKSSILKFHFFFPIFSSFFVKILRKIWFCTTHAEHGGHWRPLPTAVMSARNDRLGFGRGRQDVFWKIFIYLTVYATKNFSKNIYFFDGVHGVWKPIIIYFPRTKNMPGQYLIFEFQYYFEIINSLNEWIIKY